MVFINIFEIIHRRSVPNGDIVITIAYAGKPCTTLGYIDEINDNIAEEEEKSLITSDL